MKTMEGNALGNMLRDRRRSVPGRRAADVAETIVSAKTGRRYGEDSDDDVAELWAAVRTLAEEVRDLRGRPEPE